MEKLMNFAAICKDIQQESRQHLIQIECQSADEISIIDDTDMSRPICFHDCEKMDKNWFLDHLWIHPAIHDIDAEGIAGLLLLLDKNMFICLRHILIVRTINDLDLYINTLIPENLQCEMFDMIPCQNSNCVGQFWYYGCCIILYLDTIKKTAKEISMSPSEYMDELHAGIGITLIHEARHLLFSNPFLPEDQYPEIWNTEEKIEDYARAEFDKISHLSIFFK